MARVGFQTKSVLEQGLEPESLADSSYIPSKSWHCCSYLWFLLWSQLNHWLMIYLYVQPMCVARHSYLGQFQELKGTHQVNLGNSRVEVWHQHSLTPVAHRRSDTKKLGTKSKGICLLEAAERCMHSLSLAQMLGLDLGKEQVSCTPLSHYCIPEKTMDSRVSPAAIHC